MNSRVLLIDLQSSCYSARQIPLSTTLSYLTTYSTPFRRTRCVQKRIVSAELFSPSTIRSPEIRKPIIRTRSGNGSVLELGNNSPSTSNMEMDLFLELVPLRMRRGLCGRPEIGELIEVVLDLGRKPITRFPSGDWIISDEPVRHDDLKHAISKSELIAFQSSWGQALLLYRRLQIINTEWGGLSNGIPLTVFDRDMDAASINPGEQMLEKTISGMYLGEIARRVLLKMAEEGSLFLRFSVLDLPGHIFAVDRAVSL